MRPAHLREFRPGHCDATSAYCHTSTTQAALKAINDNDCSIAITRHLRGDWGECDPDVFTHGDFRSTDGVLRLTIHFDRHGTKYGVVTTRHRMETVVLMPDELQDYLQSVSNL